MTRKPIALLDLLTVLVTLGLAGFAVWTATSGPVGDLPMHFDADGQVDRWGDRSEAAGVFALLAAVAALAGGGCGLYAARATEDSRRRGLRAGQAVTLVATGGVGALMAYVMLASTAEATPPAAMHMAGLSLIFLMIGSILGRVGPNPVVGVRTPWAYKSRLAWERSNRLAGRLFFLIGLIGLIAAPFAPQPMGMSVLPAAIILAALAAVFESWRVWRTDPDRSTF